MAKKPKMTPREIVEMYHGPGVYERHERVQRRLLAMLEELKRREAERRRPGSG
jgi:hypothetical protein